MKTVNIFSLFLLTLMLVACNSTQKKANDALFNTTWELEYLSGPRIAFEAVFPDKKPVITFNETTNRVEGNNSCNGYSADFTLEGEAISFGEPGPTTMMFCGEGEQFFLRTIKTINKYEIDDDGKLNLMLDEVPMMRFKKVEATTTETAVEGLELGCYEFSSDTNNIHFEIASLEPNVTGTLAYTLDGKDSNSGTFEGSLMDDKLFGTYSFTSEGVESKREVAFLVKDNQLIEGYGELTENGTAFVDRGNLSYTSKMPLSKTICE